MSDHPREAVRNLKRIYICDDVWYGVFAWSGRAQLGLKIAPICARFDRLADGHFRTIRWTLGKIGFRRSRKGNRAVLFKIGQKNGILLATSALLVVPPPPNLTGFNRIQIDYVDQSVVAFLLRIRHLFTNGETTLRLPTNLEINGWRQFVIHLWPLFAQRLYKMNLAGFSLDKLRALVSPTILRDCANLRIIFTWAMFPETPADDGVGSSVGQALAMWLHTPRTDGRPKVLAYYWGSNNVATKLDQLKMAFLKAESPVSCYIIRLAYGGYFDVHSFECENERTRERMTFQKTTKSCDYWLLKRGPIWWDESEWTESERKATDSAIDKKMSLINCTDIDFDKTFV